MRFLLDTHVWIWINSFPENLSPSVVEKLENLSPNDALLLSSISLWEVCKLVERGKIKLFADLEEWVLQAVEIPGLQVIPLDFRVFYKSTTLPGTFHRDPADQMIVATARLHDATIITKDRLILDYPHVKTF